MDASGGMSCMNCSSTSHDASSSSDTSTSQVLGRLVPGTARGGMGRLVAAMRLSRPTLRVGLQGGKMGGSQGRLPMLFVWLRLCGRPRQRACLRSKAPAQQRRGSFGNGFAISLIKGGLLLTKV
eukprot:scaffold4252_cov114-Isochrysis_galbana.AAC.7